jgi:hypothetical protein
MHKQKQRWTDRRQKNRRHGDLIVLLFLQSKEFRLIKFRTYLVRFIFYVTATLRLKAGIVELQKRRGKKHCYATTVFAKCVPTATNTHITINELLVKVLSIPSATKLHREAQWHKGM